MLSDFEWCLKQSLKKIENWCDYLKRKLKRLRCLHIFDTFDAFEALDALDAVQYALQYDRKSRYKFSYSISVLHMIHSPYSSIIIL